MNKYLLKMQGIGESYFILTDKDAWDWLDYSGKNPCPQRIADKMWEILEKEHNSKNDMIKYYSNVVPDERAAYLIETESYFSTIKKLNEYIQKNKIKIIDEDTLSVY